MTFSKPFTDKEKIELLQRAVLVHSFMYYELDQSVLPDWKYDGNSKQLVELIKAFPEAFRQSRYYKYFHDFNGSTGYHLTGRIKKNKELYKQVYRDAQLAIQLKDERMQGVL